MKMIFFSILAVLIIMILIAGCTQVINITKTFSTDKSLKPLSQNEMLEDFEYMYRILKENYPFFELNKRVNNIDWLGKKSEYISLIKKAANDEEFLASLSSILADLKNGHTHMITTKQQYDSSLRNEGTAGPWFEQLNNQKAIQRYLNIPVKTASSAGGTTQNNSSSNNVTVKIIEDGKVAYLKVKSFSHLLAGQDEKVITPFFETIRNYNTLIIDIRGNGGGSDTYWQNNIVSKLIDKPVNYTFYFLFRGGDFAEKFINYKQHIEYKNMKAIDTLDKKILLNAPPEIAKDFKYYYENKNTITPDQSVNFKGKIYLIVDRMVYSASETFAVFCKTTKFASIIGEKTGGDGIGIGPILCTLPNSGYIFRFSHVMGLTSDGICNDEYKTEPDIKVSAKIYSNILNDSAVQYILNTEK